MEYIENLEFRLIYCQSSSGKNIKNENKTISLLFHLSAQEKLQACIYILIAFVTRFY